MSDDTFKPASTEIFREPFAAYLDETIARNDLLAVLRAINQVMRAMASEAGLRRLSFGGVNRSSACHGVLCSMPLKPKNLRGG